MQPEILPAFRFNATKVLLTYPNCPDVDHHALYDHLITLGKGPITYALVCRELHQDGTPHFHAFILWQKKQNVLDATHFFDFEQHHPNIVANVRSVEKCIEYVKKDGDILEYGEQPSMFDLIFDHSLRF